MVDAEYLGRGQAGMIFKTRVIRLAIFDMDGTVFDSRLDWLKIREALEIPPGENILRVIYAGQGVDTRRLEILEKYERENALQAEPIEGIADFLLYLKEENVITVLLTNNNRENADYLLEKFDLSFDQVITREMKFWKPDPAAFFYILQRYHCKPEEVISIGDSHYDVHASRGANLSHIFIIGTPGGLEGVEDGESGIVRFKDYFHLKTIINQGAAT